MLIATLLAAAAAAATPELFGGLSSELNDYNLSIDAAERTLVFARSEADFRAARIFSAEKQGEGWSDPRPIGFTDPLYADSDPWLTPDGQTLYFISTRPAPGREAGREDYDVWRSSRTATGWSAPEHLGPQVNSRGQELGPELHGGVLYFSSARRSGRGGLDIYAAAQSGAGFEPARLLEGPFNGAGSESDFTLSRDGNTALFWRSGADGNGFLHIAHRSDGSWSEPAALPESINIGPFNFTPSFSRDGRSLFYASTRARDGEGPGLADIYTAPLPPR